MTLTLEVDDIERFRSVIARRLGLRFDDAKSAFLGDVLRQRVNAHRRTYAGYLDDLENAGEPAELGALASELTVPESYFFRNMDQFRAVAEHLVQERIRAGGAAKQLRLLSAGCASGEEAYSLAIILRETMDPSWETSILAVDVNPVVLETAGRGRYSNWALRETPPDVQHRWFERHGHDFVLDESIRAAVTFEQRNLADDDPEPFSRETYDVIFCRNVMMYFTPETSRALVARLARALVPGGYLFLGHAETLRGLSDDFQLCHTPGAFFYQRECGGAPSTRIPSSGVPKPGTWRPALVSVMDETTTWVDTIRTATERVQQLTAAPPALAASQTALDGRPTRRPHDLGQLLERLRDERFAEALELVDTLPSEAADDPEVLLLHAALLTHAGLLTRAEHTCRQLLESDEHSAGAHYLLALCREGAGDPAAAVHHDRVAVSLDPRFGMPRLHLGLLARRAGDFDAVRRELGAAARLLEREDASRLLLFGGGFSREALIALCRAEIHLDGESS